MTIASLIDLPAEVAVEPWWFLAFGSLSAFVFGMGKVGFGGGISILAVPIMIFACDNAGVAIALMLPLLIAADYCGVVTWWRQWELRPLLLLTPGTLLGIAAGWVLLDQFRGLQNSGDAILKLCIGLIAAGFVILQCVRHKKKRSTFRPNAYHGTFAGLCIGISSTIAHAAGPIASIYLLPQDLEKRKFVATTVVLFWAANQIKLIPFSAMGLINTDSITLGIWLIPAVIAGAVLGKILNARLGERKFTAIIYILLALSAAGLIFKGLSEIN